MKKSKIFASVAAMALFATLFSAHQASAAVTEITVWAMQGQDGEVKAAKEEVAAFNAVNDDIHVTLKFIADMGATLKATAVADLPEAFEFDGETLGYQVYNKKLLKLNGVISAATLKNELVSIQSEGTASDGNTYSVSQFDSGLTLWGNKAMLKAAGVTYPTTWDKAWTADQFTKVLAKLAAKSPTKKAIDMKENYGIGGGWAGYAFTPIINSSGTQLVGKNGKAVGSLDTKAAAKAMATWASWKKYSDPSADDAAFTKKRVALAWVGHWATPGIKTALGKDAVLIPLPDFGQGTKSGQGSHSWAIGAATTTKKAAAAKFLEYIMTDKWINNLTAQNGAVPGTKTALANNKDYAKGGLLALYGEQLAVSCGGAVPTKKCVTVPRTISPAWPVINSTFSKAAQAIWDGGNAQAELTKAAKAIDQDNADNNGYKN